MPELEIRELTRAFASGGGVNGVSLTIESGELFVLLGPSGSGKSTLLRLIAGLETPDSGTIQIGDDDREPERDPVAMVFQNHALYPHMTAFGNIAFPLRLRRVSKLEIEHRVKEAAALASLQIDLDRRPAELSGGERQRVALARALIREPRVILMDEPLSSLDAQLRAKLRIELKEFQRRTRRTIVYVTHDQLEALTLGDRLAVMRAGRIEQVGTPAEVYQRPGNLFVASFVGQPPMNILQCHPHRTAQRIVADSDADASQHAPSAATEPSGPALAIGVTVVPIAPPAGVRGEVRMGIRPEDFALEASEDSLSFEVTFHRVEFVGAGYLAYAMLGGQEIAVSLDQPVEPRQRRLLYVARQALHFFDPFTERRLA